MDDLIRDNFARLHLQTWAFGVWSITVIPRNSLTYKMISCLELSIWMLMKNPNLRSFDLIDSYKTYVQQDTIKWAKFAILPTLHKLVVFYKGFYAVNKAMLKWAKIAIEVQGKRCLLQEETSCTTSSICIHYWSIFVGSFFEDCWTVSWFGIWYIKTEVRFTCMFEHDTYLIYFLFYNILDNYKQIY